MLSSLLRRDVLEDLRRHAEEAWPEEACGLVLSSGVRRCRNLSDHPQCGFRLGGADLLLLGRGTTEQGDRVLALYHSHPAGGAALSSEDVEGALFEGLERHPGVLHAVVSCPARRAGAVAVHRWDGNAFVELARHAPKR